MNESINESTGGAMTAHSLSSLPRAASAASRRTAVVTCLLLALATLPLAAAEEATVSGVLVANGEEISLPYVYMWAEKEGFYDPADPTWRILFVEHPVEERDLGDPVWDAAWVELGITRTAEFGDGPELQVYSQSLKLSADSGGNISGGTYPEIEIEGLGSDRLSGRVHHLEPQEFFDHTYSYDFTFSVPLFDPDAPIGEPLPAGGGEPGAAYLEWVAAIHSGDLERIKGLVPAEMAELVGAGSPEEAQEELEFMQMMTPTDIKILGGSSDGETAILQAEGMMDGEKTTFEVTLTKMGDSWVATGVSM
jgi:hypothetical protein